MESTWLAYIKVSNYEKNIEVTFVSYMNLENHVIDACKTSFDQPLKYNSVMKSSFSRWSRDTYTCIYYIQARLPWCFMVYRNRFLIGCIMYKTAQLDSCPKTKSIEHMSPVLRITYKILLITYKALNGMTPKGLADSST